MAMIEIDLGEFVDGLIAKKSRAGAIDETQLAGARREPASKKALYPDLVQRSATRQSCRSS